MSARQSEGGPRHETETQAFPIVAIGSSAGGVEALRELFGAFPGDTGMAFVVIQHLSEKTKSFLAEILGRSSHMQVLEATDGMRIEKDCVYVMPASADLAVDAGILKLVPRPEGRQGTHLPIDYFFRMLAQDQKQRAIGVVLSGTGSDGAQGLMAIRAGGGVTFAQEPRTATHPEMPRQAAETKMVDFVLAPAAIARQLLRIASLSPIVAELDLETPKGQADSEQLVNQIFLALRKATGQDFSGYKRGTFRRRLSRRMLLHRLESLQDYVAYLKQDPREVEALHRDLLIGVTEFFRDPETFAYLKEKVFPDLLAAQVAGEGLRLWVVGCANGKEAYSLAIALLEAADGRPPAGTRLFATDINEHDINVARAGHYPEEIASEVPADRLARFFTVDGEGYRVNKNVRDLCTFARHDVTHDPPFSNLDFISCRNLMIYFDAPLQERVVKTFHYALRPDGYLLLGKSETLTRQSHRFELLEKVHHLYRKRAVSPELGISFADPSPILFGAHDLPTVPHLALGPQLDSFDAQREADKVLAAAYAGSSVIIDDHMEVLSFRGPTNAFLEHQTGKASFDLFLMAREGLKHDLRRGIETARERQTPVLKKDVRVRTEDGWKRVDLEVVPFTASDRRQYFVVAFREGMKRQEVVPKGKKEAERADDDQAEILVLRGELDAAREHVQAVLHEKDVGMEELKTAYEELQSSNEELQSTNEELETAKEELQSINEELTTANEELERRNEQLGTALDDISNVLESVSVPMIILDESLHIRRFTPGTQSILNLIPSDVGRPITDIALKLTVPDLPQFLRQAISSLTPATREVQSQDGRYYSLRVRPYRRSDRRVEGAVLSFVDIDELRRGMHKIEEAATFNTSLNMVIADINSTLEFPEIMRRVLDHSVRAFEADSGGILLLSEGGWTLRYAYPADHGQETVYTEAEVRQAAEAGRTRSAVVLEEKDERLSPSFIGRFAVGSELVVPLISRDELVGALFINRKPGRRRFSESEIDYGSRLAASVSLALENARLFAAQVEQARLDSTFSTIMERLAATDNVRSALPAVLEGTGRALGMSRAFIARPDGDEWRIIGAWGFRPDLTGRLWGAREARAFPVLEPGSEPLLITDPSRNRRVEPSFVKEQGLRLLMMAPLTDQEVLDGLIVFGTTERVREPNIQERDFVSKLSSALSLALSNARHHEAEHRLAESLRARLNPAVPSIPGLEIGATARMAAEIERVGGDFYDVFPLLDGRIALLVGDVTGQGLPAAFVSDAVRRSARTLAAVDPSPAAIMDGVNRAQLESTEDPRLVTGLLVALDLVGGEAEIVAAGHPPAILCSGTCRILDTPPAPPLGFNQSGYRSYKHRLAVGDTLVLYTDGLTEARWNDELFGEPRLLRVLEKHGDLGAQERADHVVEEAESFARGKLRDDVAVLTVRWTG